MRPGLFALALLFALGGCRTAHERLVAQRLVQTQLFAAEIPVPLPQAELLLTARHDEQQVGPCDPCLLSLRAVAENLRRVCLAVDSRQGCVMLRGLGGHVYVSPAPGEGELDADVARGLWEVLDPPGAAAATARADRDVPLLAAQEEEDFTVRPGAFATLRTSTVVRDDRALFGFGAQGGVRLWVNYFLLLGAGLDVEYDVAPLTPGYATVGLHLRGEVSLWREENARVLNSPDLSLVMGVTPLLATVRGAPLGVRAMAGLQLSRVGRVPTPLLFAVGFQSLRLDGNDVSGPRVSLGVGF